MLQLARVGTSTLAVSFPVPPMEEAASAMFPTDDGDSVHSDEKGGLTSLSSCRTAAPVSFPLANTCRTAFDMRRHEEKGFLHLVTLEHACFKR